MSLNIVNDLTDLIQKIGETIDPLYTEQILKDTPQKFLSDLVHMSEIFCTDNGTADANGRCDCDLGFFNSHCTDPGKMYWGDGWITIQVLLGIFYIVLAGLTWYKLLKSMRDEFGNYTKKLKRLLCTPKYLVTLNLLIISHTRFIYVTVDPWRQNNIFNRITDRILHEMIFSSCLSILFILLLVWSSLYDAFNISIEDGNSNKFKKLRKSLEGCMKLYTNYKSCYIALIVLIYPIQIIFSYFRGIRSFNAAASGYFFLGFYFLMFFFIFLFIYYTCRLKSSLSRSYNALHKKNNKKIFSKKTYNKHRKASTEFVNEGELKNFVKEIEQKNILNLVVRYLIDPDGIKLNEGDDSDTELDYENEMRNMDLNSVGAKLNLEPKNKNEIESEINSESDNNEENSNVNFNAEKNATEAIIKDNNPNVDGGKKEKDKHKDYVLTKNDMHVLNKIFGISYLIIFVGCVIITIGMVIRNTTILHSASASITLIVISFLLEVVGLFAVYILFLKEISYSEYGNLKIIGDIENHLKNNENKRFILKFDEMFETRVKNRLSTFMVIEGENCHNKLDII